MSDLLTKAVVDAARRLVTDLEQAKFENSADNVWLLSEALTAMDSKDEATEDEVLAAHAADQEARWRWVLSELARFVPQGHAPKRHEDLSSQERVLEHLTWITTEAVSSPELAGKPEKAMRWACWTQGALVALRLVPLEDCKRLNMQETWSRRSGPRFVYAIRSRKA